jgi:hypothetical protein
MRIFVLGVNDGNTEQLVNESALPNQHLNRNKASEKQTLKIEEVFTTSTRLSGIFESILFSKFFYLYF